MTNWKCHLRSAAYRCRQGHTLVLAVVGWRHHSFRPTAQLRPCLSNLSARRPRGKRVSIQWYGRRGSRAGAGGSCWVAALSCTTRLTVQSGGATLPPISGAARRGRTAVVNRKVRTHQPVVHKLAQVGQRGSLRIPRMKMGSDGIPVPQRRLQGSDKGLCGPQSSSFQKFKIR